MPDLDPVVTMHRLRTKPVTEVSRHTHPDLAAKVEARVDKLVKAGFIQELQHPIWLLNMVLVKKKNKQIYVYIDFSSDLNKVCPKDVFLVPYVELLIDLTTSYEKLSFINGYLELNQIKMNPNVSKMISFKSSKGALLPSHALWYEECWGDRPSRHFRNLQRNAWRHSGVLY